MKKNKRKESKSSFVFVCKVAKHIRNNNNKIAAGNTAMCTASKMRICQKLTDDLSSTNHIDKYRQNTLFTFSFVHRAHFRFQC